MQRDMIRLVQDEIEPIITNCAYILMNTSTYASKSESRLQEAIEQAATPKRQRQMPHTVNLGKGNVFTGAINE